MKFEAFLVTVVPFMLLSFFIASSQSGILERAIESNRMLDGEKIKDEVDLLYLKLMKANKVVIK